MIFFQRNKAASAGLFQADKPKSSAFMFVVFLCIALMVSDYHYRYLNHVRSSFMLVAAPLQYVVDYPLRVIGWLNALVSSRTSLVNENMHLRYQQTLLEANLQRLLLLQKENSQLRELLQTARKANFKSVAAHIMAVETNTARQLLIINQGISDAVFVGQPVLDAKGVVGQIIEVGPLSSVVLMISDAKSAVPVRNYRTGERAILVGTNDIESLSLINLPRSSSIKAGDLLVTSGLANRYPEGFPVGMVASVQDMPGESFIRVQVKPLALLNRDRLVLLVWPQERLLSQTGKPV
ncbi:MAG: rod shape-determining protein MreC [Legionellaceae bacterium]|nr:rod shape-determining protein MreC [Legionellaceae bacterium]